MRQPGVQTVHHFDVEVKGQGENVYGETGHELNELFKFWV